MKKFMYLIGFIGAIILAAGIAFKLLHFSGANELFISGYLLLLLLFIPFLAFSRYKSGVDKSFPERLKLILGATSAIMAGLAGVFKVLHLQGAELLLMLGALIFIVGFLPFLFFTLYKKAV